MFLNCFYPGSQFVAFFVPRYPVKIDQITY